MIDLLLNTNNDLAIDANDLVIGNSNEQHKLALLLTKKGELKQFPSAGVGLAQFLKDDDIEAMISEVREQFTNDGMVVKSVTYNNEKLEIDADYS